MKKVGIVGWRGMVGSVLLDRMEKEGDFEKVEATFFSTSQAGQDGPTLSGKKYKLEDANSVDALKAMDVVISCQGGDYTTAIHQPLRDSGWEGYWIDAASTLRMSKDSVIILDPVNRDVIDKAVDSGIKDYIGGNCTVSLMLMGMGSLFKEDLVEWMTSMTYQAASGGGARHMKELLTQMKLVGEKAGPLLVGNLLELDSVEGEYLRGEELPHENFGVPLALSLIPWIDKKLDNGQSKEEWKAVSETNKILGREDHPVPIDGTCVRVGALRSHSQGLTIKLKKSVDMSTIEGLLKSNTEWTEFVPNDIEETRQRLNPRYVSGTLKVTVGRARKMNLGDDYLNLFTSGDQLLWGAAEPLRRMLNILL